MGYLISTLASLPVIPDIDLYIFVVGTRAWDKDFNSIIRKNFDQLAKEIGPNVAIVMGHEGVDLIPQLYGIINKNPLLQKLAYAGERGSGGILLLGTHPTRLSEKDLVLYAPLKDLEERFEGMYEFLHELCHFATTRDTRFLERFQEKPSVADGVLDMVDLKPNVFGIGLNINAAITKIRNLMAKRKSD